MTKYVSPQSLLIGAIAGGVIGAGTALMFSQKKQTGQFKKNIANTYHNLTEKAEELLEEAYDTELPEHFYPIAGALAGGVLLAATGYLLTRNSGDKSERNFTAKAECWVRKAKNILDTVDEALETPHQNKHNSEPQNTIDDVVELTRLGVRLFQNLRR